MILNIKFDYLIVEIQIMDNLTKEDYRNMYWDQVSKRKEIEKEKGFNNIIINRELINSNNQNNDLLKRINLLEQNYIYGKITGLNNTFMKIKTDIGDISIHKSKLHNNELYGKNMNRDCKFKLYYHINKYQGHDLILL